MDPDADIEKRLTDLEIKASFSEDLLDSLNLVIVRQQEQIALLQQQIAQLRERLPEEVSSGSSGARHELPPHY